MIGIRGIKGYLKNKYHLEYPNKVPMIQINPKEQNAMIANVVIKSVTIRNLHQTSLE